ncbi:uncharacterized protein FTOL_02549 [Fusarium torulosum]|uniref:Uncharacterized protein n=1 Tax=Fusarium torulosum TaxID=33205 RepID=A0AAE8M257_9HYPO|nr:uncharacterized protein FTOL_02549 [Fusarium torulosum]
MAPPQKDSDIGSRIVFMINLGMKVRNIGIDVCPKMPVNELIREKTIEFCQGIVAEIFEAAGVRKEQARQCYDEMVNRVMNGGFLKATTLANYGGWKIACLPASLLASAIAVVDFRKLRPRSGKVSQAHRDFTRMFGDMNVMQWLPIAIRVFKRTEGRPFVIEIDQEEDTKPMIVPSNACDRPLSSVENAERAPSKSTLPSTPDPTIDNDTLREYAREMKKLGKRLASPERATVKRLRRRISEFADHADKKDQDMRSERNVRGSERKFMLGRKGMKTTVPKAKKPFDVYRHYKALWKSSLNENGTIPESLRELVHHHCDSNQIFHLTEMERDFVPERSAQDEESEYSDS